MSVRHSPVEKSRFYRDENERSNSPDLENSKDQIWENVKPRNNSKQSEHDHTRKDLEKTLFSPPIKSSFFIPPGDHEFRSDDETEDKRSATRECTQKRKALHVHDRRDFEVEAENMEVNPSNNKRKKEEKGEKRVDRRKRLNKIK